MPHTTPLAEIQKADNVRLYLYNNKNRQQGSTMYHSATNHTFCSVKYLANHNHNLYSIAPEDVIIPIIYTGNIKHITTANITLEVSESIVLSRLLNSGNSLLRISAH